MGRMTETASERPARQRNPAALPWKFASVAVRVVVHGENETYSCEGGKSFVLKRYSLQYRENLSA